MIRLPKTYIIPPYGRLDDKYKGELAVAWIHAKRLGYVFKSDEDYKQWRRESAVVRYARDCGCYKKELAVTFETAVCYGLITEVIPYARTKKTWGALVSFRRQHSEEAEYIRRALEETNRVSYILLDSNPIKQKQITRNEYKLIFGPELVNRAMKSNLKTGAHCFINSLNHSETSLLRQHGMGPVAFWRDVRHGNMDMARRLYKPDKRRDSTKKHYLSSPAPPLGPREIKREFVL